MSPFRSLKNNITNSFSSVRAVEGLEPGNDLTFRNHSANETWTYGGRRYYAFTEDGYFDVKISGKADILLIGGGGSGASGASNAPGTSTDCGGGGGAGAFVEYSDVTFPTGIYYVIVGDGGTAKYFRSNGNVAGSDGNPTKLTGPSEFSSPTPSHHPAANIIQSPGGGGGGFYRTNPPSSFISGRPGGSGGGAAAGSLFGAGSVSNGWGYPGGVAQAGGDWGGSGGGGGAGGPAGFDAFYVPTGINPTNTPGPSSFYWRIDEDQGTVGGGGRSAFGGDLGIPTDYGTPGPDGGRYFAGGGPGASDDIAYPAPTSYQSPGGGVALQPNAALGGMISPRSGQKNTGAGGAGGVYNYNGGKGGSGIMIIRFEYH